MVDRDDDLRIGMRTSAITFGRFDVLAVALCYAGYLAGMVWVGRRIELGPVYFIGLLVAVGCAAYHLWLIRGRDRERCFKAFLHNHWLGLAVSSPRAGRRCSRTGAGRSATGAGRGSSCSSGRSAATALIIVLASAGTTVSLAQSASRFQTPQPPTSWRVQPLSE